MQSVVPLVVDPEEQTVAVVDSEGGATATWAFIDSGKIRVLFGDGESSEIMGGGTLSHLYTKIGEYAVTFYRGATVVAETTAVANCEAPLIAPPFYVDPLVEEGEKVQLNMARREVGCDNGMPKYYSGILPGDGVTEFRITCYATTGEKVSLFDEDGNNIWGKWIVLNPVQKDLQLVTLWALWGGDEPMHPMAAKGCDTGCGEDPWVDPVIPPNAIWMTFTMTVRNQYFNAQDYISTSWHIAVTTSGC